MYFLDTNICAFIINGSHPGLNKRFLGCNKRDIRVSSVVLYELYYGAEKSKRTNENLAKIQTFFSEIDIVPFDTLSAEVAGRIRTDLERKGQIIGAYDLMIAATALAYNGTVVTNNTREFSRVSGLTIEDWSI